MSQEASAPEKKDYFCWTCHLECGEGDDDLVCKSCPRAFHNECVDFFENYPEPITRTSKKLKENNMSVILELNKCQECVVADKTFVEPLKMLGEEKTKLILKACCNEWRKFVGAPDENEAKILDVTKYNDRYDDYLHSVVKVMDLKILEGLVENGTVRTIEALAGELKWIYHNSIHFNGWEGNDTKTSRTLQDLYFEQLNKIVTSCADCQYLYSTKVSKEITENIFLQLCMTPHPIAWAKIKGFPYWPAKIVHADEKYVEAFNFKDYTRCFLKLGDCFVFSKKEPLFNKAKNFKTYRPHLKKAVEEANKYANLMEAKFGPMLIPEEATTHLETLSPAFISKLFPEMRQRDDEMIELVKTFLVPNQVLLFETRI